MEVKKNEEIYWDSRYRDAKIGWDIGYANPALIAFVQQHFDKNVKILIPGGGHAYELATLYRLGYKNTYALDFSQTAKNTFYEANPDIPKKQYLSLDFFELKECFDLVIEQTFFCALHPSFRKKYKNHMRKIIPKGGMLAGLFFDMDKEDGPPFGGNKSEYENLFKDDFFIEILEKTEKSIEQRMGKEFFVKLIRK